MKLSISNTQVLISEIEKRPTIWDPTTPDYVDKLKRRRCWEELTDVFTSPETTTDEEKAAMCELLQKKWKNIRDRFSRDLKSGENNVQYMYREQLQFLQKSVRHFQKLRNHIASDSQEVYDHPDKNSQSTSMDAHRTMMDALDASEDESKLPQQVMPRINNSFTLSAVNKTSGVSAVDLDESEEEWQLPVTKRAKMEYRLAAPTIKKKPSATAVFLDESEDEMKLPGNKRSKFDNSLVEARLLELLERNQVERQDKTKMSQDEDRMFLMSLLTSMKSVPPHFKLKAKIEIMSVIDKYSKIYGAVETVNQSQNAGEYAILP